MFEILGSWVTSTPQLEVKLMLDRHSRHHAWRAAQWWDRLPVLADVDRDLLVREAGAVPWDASLEAVAAAAGTVSRLSAAYRVALPRLCSAYTLHRLAASEVSDGSTLRTLGIVGPDAAADWAEGELSLQSLLSDRSSVDEAAATAREVEVLFCMRTGPNRN